MIHLNISVTQKTDEDAEEEIDDEVSIPFPDLLEVCRCFELGGVSHQLFSFLYH